MSDSPDELKEQGMQLFQRGAHDEALAAFETAVNAYTQSNNQIGKAEMLNNIGVIQRLKRNYSEAIAALAEAEQIFAQVGDVNRQAQALGNMGDIHQSQGNKTEAARAYSNSAELFAKSNDPARGSQVLRSLSLLRLRQARWFESMDLMEKSLNTRPRLGVGGWLLRSMLRFALRLFTGG